MTESRPRIGFIGAGRVGTALAVRLSDAGYPVVAVSSRSTASADRLADRLPACRAVPESQQVADCADLVFVTTPDAAIADAVGTVRWRPGSAVVHTSGALSLEPLRTAADQGALVGAVHPLQTFADLEALPSLDGIVFAVEADGALRERLLRLVADLGATPLELRPEDRELYHAAAVLVSNFSVTLMKLATDLWLRFGWERSEATRALLPLLAGTLANLERLGLPNAITGPVARGDVATVEAHLEALEGAAPELAEVYRTLTAQTVPVALAKGGLSEADAAAIRRALEATQEASAR